MSGRFSRTTRGRSPSSGSFTRYGATRKACRLGRSSSYRRSSYSFYCCLTGAYSYFGKRTCSGSRRSSATRYSTGRRCLYSHNRGRKKATFYTGSTFCRGANYSRSWATRKARHTWSRSTCLTWTRPTEGRQPYGRGGPFARFLPGTRTGFYGSSGGAHGPNGGAISCRRSGYSTCLTRSGGRAYAFRCETS